jgi:hypothetical protein
MNELQAVLNLIASALLGDLAPFLSPRLVIASGETASTDGRTRVQLPEEFLGILLGEARSAPVFIGLLAHEVGHWLQPLKAVTAVEQKTGLHHDIVNLILDAHLEQLVPVIFPLFAAPLEAVREVVRDAHKVNYEQQYKKAPTFLEAVDAALLFGRFCVDTNKSFSSPHALIKRRSKGHPRVDLNRMTDLMQRVEGVMNLTCSALPAYFEKLAQDFPELCQPAVSMEIENPLDVLKSGGDGMEVIRKLLEELKLGVEGVAAEVVEEMPNGRNPASAETLALSRQLQKRWDVARTSGVIMAPGRLNRLSAVRGDPMPFTMPAAISGRQVPQTRIVLIVDWSGSMGMNENAPWKAALQAAQAIALAVRSTGGDVRAAVFAEQLWHAPDFSAELLFATGLSSISLVEARGDDTDFSWLPHIWQTFPAYRVVLLTDGNGYPPMAILPSGRKRTSAVLLQVRGNFPSKVAQIEATIQSFASSFVHVDNLRELAAAWALLIPRRMQ